MALPNIPNATNALKTLEEDGELKFLLANPLIFHLFDAR